MKNWRQIPIKFFLEPISASRPIGMRVSSSEINSVLGVLCSTLIVGLAEPTCRIPDDHKVSYETGGGGFCTSPS